MKKIMISALAVALVAGFGIMFGADDVRYYLSNIHYVCTDYSLAKAKGHAITNTAGVPLGYWYTKTENMLKEKPGGEILFTGQYRMGNKLCRVYHEMSDEMETTDPVTRTQLIEEKKRLEGLAKGK